MANNNSVFHFSSKANQKNDNTFHFSSKASSTQRFVDSANVIEKVGSEAIDQVNKKWESATNWNKPTQNDTLQNTWGFKSGSPVMPTQDQLTLKTIRSNNLPLNTLNDDINKAADAYKLAVGGWQDADTMKKAKDDITKAYTNLESYRKYLEDYGGGDTEKLSQQINIYKNVLRDWDSLSNDYGKYKSSDEYESAIKQREKQSKISKDELDGAIKKAEELEYNVTVAQNGSQYSPAYSDNITNAKNALAEYLKKYGVSNVEELKGLKTKSITSENTKSLYQYQIEIDSIEHVIEEAKKIDKERLDAGRKGDTVAENAALSKMKELLGNNGFATIDEARKALSTLKGERNALRSYKVGTGEFSEELTAITNPETIFYNENVEEYIERGEKTDRYKQYVFEDDEYRFLTKPEQRTLAYYIAKDEETGKNETEKYLKDLTETLNTREAKDYYKDNLEDNTFLEILYSVPVGLDQFASGVKNLFNTEDDYIPLSSTQIAGQLVRSDLEEVKLPEWLGGFSLAGVTYDSLSTLSNMAPSILASFVSEAIVPGSGAMVGGALLGGSAAGNAYQQALNSGMDKTQARTYSTLVGTSEALLSATLSKVMGGKAISGKLQTAIDGIESGFARFAANYGTAFVSEGLEEGIQEILEPFFENFALGYQKNGFDDIDWGEVAYSFLLGGVSGGLFETVGTVGGKAIERFANASYTAKIYNTPLKVAELIDLGLKMPENSKSYKAAKKLDSVTKSGKKVTKNQLYNAVVSTENLIADRLTQLGESNNVSNVAKAVVKQLSGVDLLVNDIEALSKSTYGQEVLNTFVPKTDTSSETSVAETEVESPNVPEAVAEEIPMPTDADIVEDTDVTDDAQEREIGFTEVTDQEIYREPTPEENAEAIFGKRKNAKQRHIFDVAKKFDSNMKVVFVSKDAKVLSGKKGVYMRESNTMYLSKDNSAVESYFQLFKHECIHRLESRGAYQGLKNYLFRNSSSFERYARAQLKAKYKTEFKGTREEALQALAQLYIDDVQNGSFTEKFKKGFTLESAQREMVADFISEVLFKGNRRNVAQHLADGNLEAIYDIEDTLSEFESLTETDRKWFEKIIDWIKDLIASLKGVNQNKRLVEDLEYIEKRLGRVFDSRDTKKAASRAGNIQFKFNDTNNSESKYIIDTIYKNVNLISKNNVFSVESEQIPEGTKKTEYVLNIFNEQGNAAENKEIGLVELVQSGAKSTVFHGFGEEKLAATKAIKTVIEQGSIIETTQNYNNTGVDRYIIAAKGYIDGKPAFVGLIVKTYPNQKNQNAKFYLHEATIIETDSPIMTAPQLSVDTVSESVYKDSVPYVEDAVNTNLSDETENYSEAEENGEGSFSLGSPAQQMRDNLKKYESGEITKEEYLEETDKLWNEALSTYGAIPEGENVKAPIPTPKAVAEDKPTERFTRTIIETDTLTDDMLKGMEEKMLLGDFSYKVISDEAAQKKANSAIENGTAEDVWEDTVNDGKRINKTQIAMGEKLLAKAIEDGDTKRVLELSAELADIFTRAGQVVQAARLLKKMTGAGRLVSLQRTVKTINKDLRAKHGEDFPSVKISPESAKRLAEAKTAGGIEYAYQEIMQEVAAQVPVTFMDKWNAWRYFAMLSNPKTHIRNVVGNAIFIPATRIRYFLAAVGEQAVSADKRTKSLVIKKEFRDFAKRDAKSQKVINLLKGNKYNDKSALREKQRIFKSDVLEFLTRFNSNALEAEDMLFKNKHYIHALAGFLQAKNVNLETVSQEVLDEARIYAVEEAKKATFNDESALANWIQNFGNKNLATSIAVEGVLPFKRTPINIVKRGVEYSPIGLTKTLTKGLYDVKKGKITVTEFIDGLASGLTGTGIMLAGMLLANLGFVSGGEDDDEKSQFEKMLGKQEYAIEIFGKSYTVDWAAPACIPFFIGAEIVNTINEGEDFQLSQFGNAVWNSLEPITNLSMLSGMQGVIESARYAEPSQIISSIAVDALTSYGMQGVPSLFGATARTIDPKQRSWYTDKNDKWLDSTAQTIKNNIQSKIPGLSYTQIPKIDMWGREVSRGGTTERILENFISPGYYSEIEVTETSEELKRIFNKTDTDVFPNVAGKSFEINGKTKYLTASEYVTYAKAKGSYSLDYVKEFMDSAAYKKLTDEERADVIQNLYKYSNAKAKTTVSDYDLMKQFKTVTNWERNGNSAVDYYISRTISK